MYDNLYCKIYLGTELEVDELYLKLNEFLQGEMEPIRTIKTKWGEIDLRRNEDYDIQKENISKEGFLYWKYYLDIEPTANEEAQYINAIANFISSLIQEGFKVIASCDFENAL